MNRRAHPRRVAPAAALLAMALLVALAACQRSEPAAFDWRLAAAHREALTPDQQAPILELLREVFGTALDPAPLTPPALAARGIHLDAPALGASSEFLLAAVRADNGRRFGDVLDALDAGSAPTLPAALAGLDAHAKSVAGGDSDAAAAMRNAVLDFRPPLAVSARVFASQCLSCHGREGGGDGPAAAAFSPRPRDLRQGVFQHFDSSASLRPRPEDLVRVLYTGIEGGAMPAFRRFSTAELAGLADLVRLLALRGEVESRLVEDVRAGRAIDRERALYHLAMAAEPWTRPGVVATGGDEAAHSPAPAPHAVERP